MFSVLVVENELAIAGMLGQCVSENRWLSLAGVATTKQDAIEMAGRLRPDLVLLDFGLPESAGLPESKSAGFEVWHVLHRFAGKPLYVIAVTATADMNTVELAQNHGAFDFVVKPFAPATIHAKLADYVDNRRRRMAAPPCAGQDEINRWLKLRHRSCPLPAGLQSGTLDSVVAVLREASGPLRVAGIASRAGVDRGTANRYLNYLHDQGIAIRVPEHGFTGHPAFLYTLAPVWEPAPEGPRPG
jgi:response regulator of citrate/malate metabolism